MAGHQPDGHRETRRRRHRLRQRAEDVEVQRPRVDLPDAGQHPSEAEKLRDPPFQLGQFRRIRVQQVEHVLAGPDRALHPTQRIAGKQLLDPLKGDEQLLPGRSEAFAERGGLCGDVVAASGQHQCVVFGGQAPEAGQRRDHAPLDQQQRAAYLELFDILGKIPRCHALVYVLMAGKSVELLDPGLHVMPADSLPARDRIEIDVGENPLIVLDHPRGDVEAQVPLGAQHRQPQPAFLDNLVRW